MSVKLLTEHHLKFLSLKGGCTGSSESTYVKMAHCWKSHAAAQISLLHVYDWRESGLLIDLICLHESVCLPTGLQIDIEKTRPPDKSAYWKTIFFISHPKHMLRVLKRTVSIRRFF